MHGTNPAQNVKIRNTVLSILNCQERDHHCVIQITIRTTNCLYIYKKSVGLACTSE